MQCKITAQHNRYRSQAVSLIDIDCGKKSLDMIILRGKRVTNVDSNIHYVRRHQQRDYM